MFQLVQSNFFMTSNLTMSNVQSPTEFSILGFYKHLNFQEPDQRQHTKPMHKNILNPWVKNDSHAHLEFHFYKNK